MILSTLPRREFRLIVKGHFLAFLRSRQALQLSASILLIALLVTIFSLFLPGAVDWHTYYRPAALLMAAGKSPFDVAGFVNAPWVLLPLLPLIFLPEQVGRAVIAAACLLAVLFTAWKLGAKPFGVLWLLLSPPFMQLIYNGNVDWLVVLGFVFPPQVGLFFILIKPQMGFMLAIFWFIQAWRKNGLREVFRVFAPVTIVLLASFGVYGFWPTRFFNNPALAYGHGNSSLWPLSIPIGLVLFYQAVKRQRADFSIAACPFLSPYLTFHSWIGALLAFSSYTVETFLAVAGLWIVTLIRAFGY